MEAGTCSPGQGLDRDQAGKSFLLRANMVQPMIALAATMTTMMTGWGTQVATAMKEGGLLHLVRRSGGQGSRNKPRNYRNMSMLTNEKTSITFPRDRGIDSSTRQSLTVHQSTRRSRPLSHSLPHQLQAEDGAEAGHQ